ncbi:hypothetical protein B0H17DRAFT_919435 [Mycena rosella]|uniref:Pentatricopeptide repeat-containing protein n=1 Tax=Mycena rosella TaxID=1033263 RepID=A0AAD7GV85_MYCRO|nr:hypothetical protein B0H17DRAFT_919435 [Mycena rosella]
MSLRTGLVRAARLPHSLPRLPPRLFVRASHDAYTESRLEHFLRPLRYPDEPNAVRRHYLPLVEELDRLKNAEPASAPLPELLTREQLLTIIDLLATSGRPPDLECIRSMFSHLPVYFNITVTEDLHTVVLAALLRQGFVPLAKEWITRIPELPPHLPPTIEHFHTFLRGAPDHLSLRFLRDVMVLQMRRAGVRPNNETYSILVQRIVSNATHSKVILKPEAFTTLIGNMIVDGVAPDPSIPALISDYFIENGYQRHADHIRKYYDIHFPDNVTPEQEQIWAWKTQLKAASQEAGVGHALDVFRGLTAQGCPTTHEMFRAILNSSRSVEDIQLVEEALGLQAGAPEYGVLVNNHVWVKQVDEALAVYEHSKQAGVVPMAGLVGPIIRSLCSGDRKPAVHDANVDRALELYTDLDEAYPVSEPDLSEASVLSPDTDIYTSLMHGLSRAGSIKTAYPIAQALFADMRARGIALTNALKTSNIILEMRSCDTLEGAFQCYRKRRADLTENGYLAVLHAISRMSLSLDHPDSLEHYFLIVADMRLAGFRISDKIYTDILRQFAELANIRKKEWRRRSEEYKRDRSYPMPPNLLADLEAAVRQLHDLVSVDKNITPERIVWNQFMNTYQHLGDFPAAFRVWEKLYYSGKYGPVAVSIIFDACGHAFEYEMAKTIADRLIADNYVFNLHNWNSYVECMCRTSHISDALRVVCTEMGTFGQPVKPDLDTLTILLKFAESTAQTNIILQRVRRFLPELWEIHCESTGKPP